MVCPYGLGIPYIRRWRWVGGGFGVQLLRHGLDFLAVANMRPNFFSHIIFGLGKGIMRWWRRDSHHVLLEMGKAWCIFGAVMGIVRWWFRELRFGGFFFILLSGCSVFMDICFLVIFLMAKRLCVYWAPENLFFAARIGEWALFGRFVGGFLVFCCGFIVFWLWLFVW